MPRVILVNRVFRSCVQQALSAVVFATVVPAYAAPVLTVSAVRFWSLGDVTRVVIEVSGEFRYQNGRLTNPDRIFFDIQDSRSAFQRAVVHTISVGDGLLKQIRVAQMKPTVTRVVLDVEPGIEYAASQLANPSRLIVELRKKGGLPPGVPTPAAIRVPPPERSPAKAPPPPPLITTPAPVLRVPAHLPRDSELPVFARLSIRGVPKPPLESKEAPEPKKSPLPAPAPAAAAQPPVAEPAKRDSRGGRSMTRALGLKLTKIVIDPGHGGHDTGTIGPKGLMEKALVLDIAKRLGALIEERLGADVVYTRTSDTFVPLEERTAIANAERADLFISLHANSSPVRTTSGVETYYLNFTSSKESLEVAARENASSQKSIHELKDLLQKIALSDKIEESRELATKVQNAQHALAAKGNPKLRNRGVKKAPFVVLIGASMPSVLTEIGFLSNPRDEALFNKPDYRQRVAEAIFKGISQYVDSLSHFQTARKSASAAK